MAIFLFESDPVSGLLYRFLKFHVIYLPFKSIDLSVNLYSIPDFRNRYGNGIWLLRLQWVRYKSSEMTNVE